MSVTSDFYHARAEECAREAASSPLDNVRERFERSASAWKTMADRLARGEALRAVDKTSKQPGLPADPAVFPDEEVQADD